MSTYWKLSLLTTLSKYTFTPADKYYPCSLAHTVHTILYLHTFNLKAPVSGGPNLYMGIKKIKKILIWQPISIINFSQTCTGLFIFTIFWTRDHTHLIHGGHFVMWSVLGFWTNGEFFQWNTIFWLLYSWYKNTCMIIYIYMDSINGGQWELCVKVW